MNNLANEQQPVLSHAEPVLPVPDVSTTIRYWQEVLAFPNKWTWGEPPSHGGVSWHGAMVQFSQNSARAKASAGNTIWIRVKYIDRLYEIHRERKAEIVHPLQREPWGMDEYVVKEENGYYLVFSGHIAARSQSSGFPENIRILERMPTPEELTDLARSVGWAEHFPQERLHQHLSAPVFGVVAVDTDSKTTIGCALVLSDLASFYYVKDVMVKPEWQKKRIGTALMKSVSSWLDQHGVSRSLVGLYTGENLEPFYRQFGFTSAFGMHKRLS